MANGSGSGLGLAGELELGCAVSSLAELANSFCRRKRCSLAPESQLGHGRLLLHSSESFAAHPVPSISE